MLTIAAVDYSFQSKVDNLNAMLQCVTCYFQHQQKIQCLLVTFFVYNYKYIASWILTPPGNTYEFFFFIKIIITCTYDFLILVPCANQFLTLIRMIWITFIFLGLIFLFKLLITYLILKCIYYDKLTEDRPKTFRKK